MTTKFSALKWGLVLLSSSGLSAMVSAAANGTQKPWIEAEPEIKSFQPLSRTNPHDSSFVDELTVVSLGNDSYQLKRKGHASGQPKHRSRFIHLKNRGAIDPLDKNQQSLQSARQTKMAPEIAGLYQASANNSQQAYIIQFDTQALPADQLVLRKQGARVVSAFPPNALLVLASPKLLKALKNQPNVRAIIDYLPVDKLQSSLTSRLTGDQQKVHTYSIMAVAPDFRQALENQIQSNGGVVLTSRGDTKAKLETSKPGHRKPGAELNPTLPLKNKSSRFSAELNAYQLKVVLASPYTLYVDDLGDPDGEDVDDVREREGFNWIEQVAGYTGQGVALEAYDRGFQIDHVELANTPNPILVRSPAPEGSGGADHGTDIAGILFAQGVNPKYRGLLPDAARPIVFSRYSGFPGTKQPTEAQLHDHLAELVDPNGPYRAIAQTSSTDYSTTLDYTTWSAEYDEVIFELDLIKLQSQSNTHNQLSRPAAWAKNTVAVGGIKTLSTLSRADDGWNNGASIGPAADNRIKPDLSGQYDAFDMIADGDGTTYNARNGTSFSTPATAGAFGILFQMWADGVFDGGPGKQGAPWNRDVFDARPHATTAKALMIHSAYRYDFSGDDSHNLSRIKQGWGFPDLKNLYQLAEANNWTLPVLVNESDVVLPGGSNSYTLTVDGTQPLMATMVYKDPRGNPAAVVARINDLSLKVTSPSGTVYWGNNGLRAGNWSIPGGTSNTIDTVENVFIQAPEAGTWTIEVVADDIVQDGHTQTPELDADYALVASGGSSAPPTNQPPVVDAGADGSVQIPNAVSLNGVVSDDGFAGTSLIVSWSKLSGPGLVSFANANSAATSATFDTDGTYVLQLTANDTEYTVSDQVTIRVTPPPQNQAPVATAGNDIAIELPAPANLSGSCSDDGLPVGSSVNSLWSGPPGVSFANAASTTTSATFSNAGSYTLTLTCDDGDLTGQDSLLVTVAATQPNQAPSVNAGADGSAVVGSPMTLSASASDDGRPYGSSLTLSWSSLSGPGSVTFGDASSANSSATFSAAGQYVLELSASDGDLTATDTMTVTVSEVPVDLSNDSFETGTGDWSNVSAGDNYDWTRNSGGTPSSSTGPATGAGGSGYYMYLETSSGSGAYNAGDTAILQSVSYDGSHRSFGFDYHMYGSNMGTLALEISENNGAWNPVWSKSGQQHTANSAAWSHADVDLSSYAGAIRLRFKATAAGGYRGDMAIDNLVLTGIDTPPVNQSPTASAGADQTITLPADASLSGSCSDDGLPSGNNLSCSWSGPAGVTFANANAAVTTASFAAAGSYTLTLTASDGELSASDSVTITVNPPPANQAPVSDAGNDLTVTLAQGASLAGSCSDDGLPVGSSLSASWSGDPGVTFADANSATTTASFAATGQFRVTLSCSDGELSTSDSALITVNDAPPPPVEIFSDNFANGLGNWSNTSVGDDYDWTQDTGGTPSGSTGPATGAGGSNSYVYLETSNGSGAYNAGDTALLLSPVLDASNVQLSFAYHMYGSNMGTLSVDVKQGGSWITDVWSISGQQHTSSTAEYTNVSLDLSSYAVEQIRFRATAAGGYRGDMALDNLVISGVIPPAAPVFNSDPLVKSNAIQDQAYSESIAADASDANGDNLTFSKVSGPAWLTVAADGSLSGTPSAADLGVNSFTVAVSDGALTSQAVLQINVVDGSIPVVLTSTDFESGLGDWNNVTGDNFDWTRNSGGTPSNSTGPTAGANNSGWYVYLETSSSNGAYNQGETAYLESNDITGSSRSLSFDYHMYGAEIGILSIDVLANGNWQNDVLSLSGQQQPNQTDAWKTATVDLSAYTGTIKIRMRATAAGGWKGDIALDNLIVSGQP